METRDAYDQWASQYDTNENRTRDLEARSLRECLSNIPIRYCLEIGCGTGKNTVWLADRAEHITAVDLSEEMMAKAKEKIKTGNVDFVQSDITGDWTFSRRDFDLVTFSLVLEHIRDLDQVFYKACQVLRSGGFVYIGELHPFKQYTGSKARFQTGSGEQVVPCFTHHLSEFIQCSKKHGLLLEELREYFDEDSPGGIPRILSMVLKKC